MLKRKLKIYAFLIPLTACHSPLPEADFVLCEVGGYETISYNTNKMEGGIFSDSYGWPVKKCDIGIDFCMNFPFNFAYSDLSPKAGGRYRGNGVDVFTSEIGNEYKVTFHDKHNNTTTIAYYNKLAGLYEYHIQHAGRVKAYSKCKGKFFLKDLKRIYN